MAAALLSAPSRGVGDAAETTVLIAEQGAGDLSVPADMSEHALADHAWKGDGSRDVWRRIAAVSAS